METTSDQDLRDWRLHELRRLGFNHHQRETLLELIENGDTSLHDLTDRVHDLWARGCPPDLIWWIVS